MSEENINREHIPELEVQVISCDKSKQIPRSSFDPVWYLDYYLDVRENGLDATQHYLMYGIYEGRLPTAAAWRATQPVVVEEKKRDLVKQVCRIISTSDVDDMTIDRYCHLLIEDLENIVDIARELINAREVVQRSIDLEKKLYAGRRTKVRMTEFTEVPDSLPGERRSSWGARDGVSSRVDNEDLDLLNILDSGKTIDVGKVQVPDNQTQDDTGVGRSLAEMARHKRTAILKSI